MFKDLIFDLDDTLVNTNNSKEVVVLKILENFIQGNTILIITTKAICKVIILERKVNNRATGTVSARNHPKQETVGRKFAIGAI